MVALVAHSGKVKNKFGLNPTERGLCTMLLESRTNENSVRLLGNIWNDLFGLSCLVL